MDLQSLLDHERFPRSARYDAEWVFAHEMGPHVLWLAESLCEVLPLEPGLRVLDLGCGTALSSIFLAKEFGVEVWATDLWIPAADNARRIREAGLDQQVIPIHADARHLPFADAFFDVVVSIDAYHYFGTDVHYLESHLLRHVVSGGRMGMVSPALLHDVPLPDHLPAADWYWINPVAWWREHWARVPGILVEHSGPVADGWDLWVRWLEALMASGRATRHDATATELAQLRRDEGANVGFIRQVGITGPGNPPG